MSNAHTVRAKILAPAAHRVVLLRLFALRRGGAAEADVIACRGCLRGGEIAHRFLTMAAKDYISIHVKCAFVAHDIKDCTAAESITADSRQQPAAEAQCRAQAHATPSLSSGGKQL